MKNFMQKLINVFTTENHYLVIDKFEMLDALCVIGNRNKRLEVGCRDNDDLWYLDVDTTENQWRIITFKLDELGYNMVIKGEPNVVYLTKKKES